MSQLALARRAARRAVRAVRPVPPPAPPERLDPLLEAAAGPQLDALEAELATLPDALPGADERLRRFADLDPDVWALLLCQQQDRWPRIAALLPAVPDPSLQTLWNGTSGVTLAGQSAAFYAKVREHQARFGAVGLGDARVLDYGCGWGRLTRMFARDVAPGALHGCDPVEMILDVCRQARVPAVLTRTPFLPTSLPYEEPFDLAFSFSVFTHISERATAACLGALAGVIRPGGLLVATVRPPSYLDVSELMHPVRDALGAGRDAALREPRHLFVPHAAEESHPQWESGEMHYGEALITVAQVRERWAPAFELVAVAPLAQDLQQLVVTLRRTDVPAPSGASSYAAAP